MHTEREDEITVENLEKGHGARGIPDDHLATTRMPPLARPHASMSASSQAQLAQPSGQLPPTPKTSWWRALIASTMPPPGRSSLATDPRAVDRAVALVCGATGLFLFLIALIIGLREAPSQPSVAASVAVAVVIARVLLALAVLAIGAMFLRMAERFFTGRSRD
ncbi:MAG TPA: hypothetical protein VGY54_17420 [Polyangiaceae bacterium]|nr:hypothetical protein [Polyangiaceae bacterium]